MTICAVIKCGNYKVCNLDFSWVIYSCFLLLFHYWYCHGLLSLWRVFWSFLFSFACFLGSSGYKGIFSPVDTLQIAVVVCWVVLLLFLIFVQKFRYLCLTKSVVLLIFQLHPLETTGLRTNFLSYCHFFWQ